MSQHSDDPATNALHADAALRGEQDVAPPLRPSTTFRVGEGDLAYRRDGDPGSPRLEAVVGALEGGHSVAYPSGMAAVRALLDHLSPERISMPEEAYGGVVGMVDHGAETGQWALVDPDQLGPGDLCWLETPSNPRLFITDVAAVAAANRSRGVVTAVDATFATPVLQQTLSLGADFVMHSTTKFIAGHSDAMGGVIVTGDDAIATELREARRRNGFVPGTLEMWLTLRGVRTLPLRAERQSATAQVIAEHLVGAVPIVHYPGLPSHPGHEIAARQMKAFGGIVSFEMASEAEAASLVERFELFTNATSLGGVESLAEHRIVSDAAAPPGLIRMSIGLEAPEDLTADLDQALARV